MGKTHYVAVYSDSGCLCGCDHKHATIAAAVACISQPGGYVVAVRQGKYRHLDDAEQLECQRTTYGERRERQKFPAAGRTKDFRYTE
jgi:hypothetical protein